MKVRGLFNFYNAFDDVTVALDDASHDGSGPFEVSLTFGAPEIAPDIHETETFTAFAPARARLLELIGNEIDAVIGASDTGDRPGSSDHGCIVQGSQPIPQSVRFLAGETDARTLTGSARNATLPGVKDD
jgi:hypothetical protein